MKKALCFTVVKGIVVLLFICMMLGCQAKKAADQKIFMDAEGKPIAWFTSNEIAPNVWRIDDHGTDNMYLVLGEEKALLIDNGVGVADLAGYVKTLTDLPLLVVNTHGHPDHAGANFQFKEAYGQPLDFEMANQFNTLDYHNGAIENYTKQSPVVEPLMLKDLKELSNSAMLPIEEGYVFDLGNRKLEVIATPGHTPGSICLLDSANKQLFTGDNNNVLTWMFLSNSLPMEVYLQTLEKLKALAPEYDVMYPGHGDSLEPAFLDDMIACVKQVISGECKGEPYQSFAGDALQCTFGKATVAFDPNKLHAAK